MAERKSNGPSENKQEAAGTPDPTAKPSPLAPETDKPLPATPETNINRSPPATETSKQKRGLSKKTIGTIVVTVITSVITSLCTVATGWLNYPLEKKKLELTTELQKGLEEHDKKFEAELERIKAQVGLNFTAPRLITEGVTAQQLKEDARIRDLIARINDQFVTTVATESTKPLAGQPDSQQLWEILQNCHLPDPAVEGTRKFHTQVQAFLQRYSDKSIPRYPSPEAESALSIERSLRAKAIQDLNRWLEQHSNGH